MFPTKKKLLKENPSFVKKFRDILSVVLFMYYSKH